MLALKCIGLLKSRRGKVFKSTVGEPLTSDGYKHVRDYQPRIKVPTCTCYLIGLHIYASCYHTHNLWDRWDRSWMYLRRCWRYCLGGFITISTTAGHLVLGWGQGSSISQCILHLAILGLARGSTSFVLIWTTVLSPIAQDSIIFLSPLWQSCGGCNEKLHFIKQL